MYEGNSKCQVSAGAAAAAAAPAAAASRTLFINTKVTFTYGDWYIFLYISRGQNIYEPLGRDIATITSVSSRGPTQFVVVTR